MPRTIFITWLKYVNNLRIISSKTSVYTSTNQLQPPQTIVVQCSQTQLNKLSLLHFYTNISTYVNSLFNQLNNSFTHNPQSLLLELIKEN
jgi:hypothetical protein